ncbi:MAG: aldo/keto reductase, partial [Lentisphaerae bacterium]|nr:aldo/keto reductase [Lentisphaerota bacterium]
MMAKERGQTLAQMALAWVMRRKTVTSALIGASSVKQIEDCVATIKKTEFTDNELSKIENILKG